MFIERSGDVRQNVLESGTPEAKADVERQAEYPTCMGFVVPPARCEHVVHDGARSGPTHPGRGLVALCESEHSLAPGPEDLDDPEPVARVIVLVARV